MEIMVNTEKLVRRILTLTVNTSNSLYFRLIFIRMHEINANLTEKFALSQVAFREALISGSSINWRFLDFLLSTGNMMVYLTQNIL